MELRIEVPARHSLGHSVEKLKNDKKLHASMARIYPVLIGTFSLGLAWLKPILCNYHSLEFAREILKLMNKVILLYIIEHQNKK